ncbi:MAG: ribonuclease HII, partial [Desulfovibrionaceae bacterium]|nr:ribonuclease HII [Desulfovibrionaceae bacterium]
MSLLSRQTLQRGAADMPGSVGIDEAGCGCLAGPVVAGAVVLPPEFHMPGLGDSKKIPPELRKELAAAIRASALAWGIGLAWPWEIDRVNILQATFRAMIKAARRCAVACPSPLSFFIDGSHTIPEPLFTALSWQGLLPRQQAVIRGDALVPAISAASILAKTFRDKLMRALARRYPGYGFERHKGYGTVEHLQALAMYGPCRMHRLTFRKVRPEGMEQGTLL